MTKLSKKSHDKEFIKKVEEISGENFLVCMQCGTCSAACPMREEIDVPTHKVMQLTRFGLKEKFQDTNTAWVCASCHTCADVHVDDVDQLSEAGDLLGVRAQMCPNVRDS